MNGVLDMAFLSIIRRWHKREHVPIREISRRTGVSRNTIRKYLRSDIARHLRCPVSDSKDVRSLREAKVALLTL
jgi:IS30 family transposase